MSDKKFQIIIDCGSSKIRAGAFNEESKNNPFFIESNFYTEQFNLKPERIILFLLRVIFIQSNLILNQIFKKLLLR